MSDRSGERDRVASEMTLSDVLASEAETDRMTAKLYRELERKIAIEKRRRGNR